MPESAVANIRVGAAVEVRVDALNRTLPGTVARSAGKVNPDTRTMETEVDVANPDLTLVPGMYAHASIALAHARGVIVMPVRPSIARTRGRRSSSSTTASSNGMR